MKQAAPNSARGLLHRFIGSSLILVTGYAIIFYFYGFDYFFNSGDDTFNPLAILMLLLPVMATKPFDEGMKKEMLRRFNAEQAEEQTETA